MEFVVATYTHKDIRKFITYILETGSALEVDEQGMIRWVGTEDPITVDIDGKGNGIIHTYTTNAKHPDAVILNPFAEGFSLSVDRKWFYRATSIIFSKTLARIMELLLETSLSEDNSGSPELVPYLKQIAGADAKMIQELQYIADAGNDGFCSMVYNSKTKETKLFLGIEDPTEDYQKAFPTSKVRKKTWTVLRQLLRAIFKTNGPVMEDYIESTTTNICPQFRTYLALWYRCWTALKPIMAVTELYELTVAILEDLEEHMDRIDVYHKMCYWAVQSNVAQNAKSSMKPVSGKLNDEEPTSRQKRWDNVVEPEPVQPTSRFANRGIQIGNSNSGRRSRWESPSGYNDSRFSQPNDPYYGNNGSSLPTTPTTNQSSGGLRFSSQSGIQFGNNSLGFRNSRY